MITTDGVVIGKHDQGDNGWYLKVLSPDLGLIDVSARGQKKQGASNSAAVQLFACSTMCLNDRGGRYYLDSSRPKMLFYHIREDVQLLSLASYFAQLISFTVTENQTARDIYRLLANCLYMLSERSAGAEFIKFIFEMRLCTELGMIPGLLGCADCYRTESTMYFDIPDGIFLCREHFLERGLPGSGDTVEITAGMLEAMRYVCLSSQEKLFCFNTPHSTMSTLSRISERYVRYRLERDFPALDFYYSVSAKQ